MLCKYYYRISFNHVNVGYTCTSRIRGLSTAQLILKSRIYNLQVWLPVSSATCLTFLWCFLNKICEIVSFIDGVGGSQLGNLLFFVCFVINLDYKHAKAKMAKRNITNNTWPKLPRVYGVLHTNKVLSTAKDSRTISLFLDAILEDKCRDI